MNLKRLLAGILACCIVGGALPSFGESADKAVITVSAADDDEYTEGTYESLTYRKYENYIEISGCDESATSVVIPAEIDGVPVTHIGVSAFQNCSSLESIKIPDSVTSIGWGAFWGCSELTEINIPDSVTNISEVAFWGCSGLTEINIPDGIIRIADRWFENCSGLTKITIPDSVTWIGMGAFYNCSVLTEITIPDSVTRISISAFEECEGLSKITILNPNCEIADYIGTISNGYDENDAPYFNGTIYGYDNSTAQAYAEKYDRNFVSLGAAPEKAAETGDIDGDGIIDSSDASIVLAEYSLLSTGKDSTLSASQKKLADLNKDGTIDSSDASLILAYYSHTATGGTDSIDVFLEKQGY